MSIRRTERTLCDPSGGRLRRYTGGICPIYLIGLILTIAAMLLGGCDDGTTGNVVPEPIILGALRPGTLYVGSKFDGRVHAIDLATGADSTLVSGTDPTITAEGTLVVDHSAGLVEYTPGVEGYRVIVPRVIGKSAAGSSDDTFRTPRVSPNGSWVAYVGDFHDVHVVDRWSGELVASFSTGDRFTGHARPVWTPESLLMMSEVSDNAYRLVMASEDFGTLTTIDTGPLVDLQGADISRDGSAIVATGWGFLVSIDTEEPSLYTDIKEVYDHHDVYPTWSHDGTLIGRLRTTYPVDNSPWFHSDGRGYAVIVCDPVTKEERTYRLASDLERTHPYGLSQGFAIR